MEKDEIKVSADIQQWTGLLRQKNTTFQAGVLKNDTSLL